MTSLLLPIPLSGKSVRGIVTSKGDQRFSVYDFINLTCGKPLKSSYGNTTFFRMTADSSKHQNELLSLCENMIFPGSGQRGTPTMTASGLIRLLQVLGGKISRAFRDETLHILERYLDGDTSLCKEIEANLAMGKPKSYAKFTQQVLERQQINEILSSRQMPQTAYVYATKSAAFPGLIKIGRAVDVAKRVADLNTGCAPAPHVVVALAPTFNYSRDEHAAHVFFANVRREGEFFETSESEVIAYFATITSIYHSEFAVHSARIIGCQLVIEEV